MVRRDGLRIRLAVIRVDGEEEDHFVPRSRAIKEAGRIIGARVLDTVNLHDGRVMLVDDLGHGKKKLNPKATKLYHSVCRPGTAHTIVGDVAILVDADLGDD
jgi:hypothetical protein